MPRKKRSNNLQEVANAAKTLYANIRFTSPDNPIRTLAITSAVPNEGKTTTALELASSMASADQRVLLVEADMRHRSLANILGTRSPKGAYAVVSGQATLDEAVRVTSVQNLDFLDTELGIPNPADVLQSKGYANLIAQARERYDYVIFDTPPVGTFVDAAILSTNVDGTLLVVRNGFTKRDAILDAHEQLQKAGANVLGICATFCPEQDSEYYYSYYKHQG